MARRYSPQRSHRRSRNLNPQTVVKPKWRFIWVLGLLTLWLMCTGAATFYPLSYRVTQYPQWKAKPPVEEANGDLVYPDWFEGNWHVQTTLIDAVAPLAPDVVTPGFEGNQNSMNQPVTFSARFVRQDLSRRRTPTPSLTPWGSQWRSPQVWAQNESSDQPLPIVADRGFNGLNLMRATLNQTANGLGDRLVKAVEVDADNPNRQVTRMEGDRQLISIVTGRLTESMQPDRFITTEVFQQIFRGLPQPYLNEVESTTDYRYSPDANQPITADQITAIYLSPRDPDYFKAGDHPVALYRYRLEFSPEATLLQEA